MSTCWLCPNPLEGDHRTGEHIIPSAVGGRKEVFSFICRTCNSELGTEWEAELAKQFLWFSSAAGTKRDRTGKHPDFKVMTATGEKLRLRADSVLVPDGHDVSVDNTGDRIRISICSNSTKTNKNLLKKLALEYPEFDFENAVLDSASVDSFLDQPLRMNVRYGGAGGGRSMVKSSLALLSDTNVDKEACGRALAYLLDPRPEATQPFSYFFDLDLIPNRPQDHLFHCVSVVGQPQEGRILGYVELFNFARILIHIGDGYSGKAFQKTYAIDPVAGKTLDLSVDFGLVKGRLEDLFQMPSEPPKMFIEAAERAGDLVMALNRDRVTAMVFSKAGTAASKALGLDPSVEEPPHELRDEWFRLFLEGVRPYIEAQMKNSGSITQHWPKDE